MKTQPDPEKSSPKFLFIVLVLIVLAVLVVLGIYGGYAKKEKTITALQLQKAVDVQELSTAEFTYNGVAVYEKNKKEIYIKYASRVKAGIDLKDVVFTVQPAEKKIEITLPKIKINDVIIDTSFIDYIPSNPDLELKEVIRVCKDDVRTRAIADGMFLETASNNLKAMMSAVIRPLIADRQYEIVFDEANMQPVQEVSE